MATLFSGLLAARARYGKRAIVEDSERKPLTYKALAARSLVLGRLIARVCPGEAALGLMLPGSAGAVVTFFFALQSQGRVPAMLNFSAGPTAMAAACRVAKVSTVLTSKRFVEKAELEEAVRALETAGLRIIMLEDLRTQLNAADKCVGALAMAFPALFYKHKANADSPPSSCSPPDPKARPREPRISHGNILSNIAQLAEAVDFGPKDRVFNCLPMFHSL